MYDAVDINAGHAQGGSKVYLHPEPLVQLAGDGGGDGRAVVCQAHLEVRGVGGVDAMGGERVEALVYVSLLLAGAGDAGGPVVRVEAIGHGTVTSPALPAGGGAEVAKGAWTCRRSATPIASPSGWWCWW